MPAPCVQYRDVGSGDAVICLHSSASSSSQWRSLVDQLSGDYRVLVPDLYGCGKSPPWPENRPMLLNDEVKFLESIFSVASHSYHLLGHTYGGAVAASIALSHPSRLKSFMLYEPGLWGMLATDRPQDAAVKEITAVKQDTDVMFERGNLDGAAQRFLDYFVGAETWSSMPPQHRIGVLDGMSALIAGWRAGFAESRSLTTLATIDVPTLLLTGSRSPNPARILTGILNDVIPNSRVVEFADIGHMGPVTHSAIVNDTIVEFLRSVQ